MKDKELFSAIYDIVDDNMKQSGHKLRTPKALMLSIAAANPGRVDILRLSRERNNDTFLKKAYITMLNRQIDKHALKDWRTRYKLPPEEFQRRVVNAIKGSEEFYNSQVKIYNNIYSSNNSYGGNIANIGRTAGLTGQDRMIKAYSKTPDLFKRVYKKMPEFVKNAARKATGINR